MKTAPSVTSGRPGVDGASSFGSRVCRPFLLDSQNADGGWGYHPGSRSAVEPSCLALLALPADSHSGHAGGAEPMARGLRWLCSQQLADGSWAAFPGQLQGCWVTSLACLVLSAEEHTAGSVARGVRWLCDSLPAEGGIWQTIRIQLFARRTQVRQNSRLKGWSWTSGTASWVEPTACSLLALQSVPLHTRPRAAQNRMDMAAAMLYDRMCPGGGWNSGNPLVYGVPGQPRVGPTSWALLALRANADRQENHSSLRWLESAYDGTQGPGSLAMAHFCLKAHGREVPPLDSALEALYSKNEFFQDTSAMAWAAIALAGRCPSLAADAGELVHL